jgi:hypothetical protein
MSNNIYFLSSKLFNKLKHNLKSHKVIILILLIILLLIFFVNNTSVFKIIEGNKSCKFSNKEEMKKDTEKKANNYKNNKTHNRKDEVNKSESILSRVEGVNVDIPER